VLVRPDFARYRAVSQQVDGDPALLDPLVEPPLSSTRPTSTSRQSLERAVASNVAKKLKALIREQLNLSASAGVAPNKFLAKIARAGRSPTASP